MLGRLLDRLDLAVSAARELTRTPPACADLRPRWQRALDPWRLPGRCPDHSDPLPLLRHLAPSMCQVCWRRWVVFRSVRHCSCARALSSAIDTYYERTR
jgi:hypothetical protein